MNVPVFNIGHSFMPKMAKSERKQNWNSHSLIGRKSGLSGLTTHKKMKRKKHAKKKPKWEREKAKKKKTKNCHHVEISGVLVSGKCYVETCDSFVRQSKTTTLCEGHVIMVIKQWNERERSVFLFALL